MTQPDVWLRLSPPLIRDASNLPLFGRLRRVFVPGSMPWHPWRLCRLKKHFTIGGESPPLDSIDIRGKIVTVDALHSTKDFAAWLKGKEADYVFPMKGNRKKLIDRLDMLNRKIHIQ